MRKRNIGLTVWSILALIAWLSTDPDLHLYSNLAFGGQLISLVVTMVSVVPFLVIFHIARKLLFDYLEADYRVILSKATKSPIGAGLAALSLSLMMMCIAALIISSIWAF